MTTKLSGPMLAPQSGGLPRQVVVLLHGYGSDGQDLIALGQHWRSLLPEALFVAPNAPDACPDNPMGYQWFPLRLDRTISRVEGAPEARDSIAELLDELWAQTGLGPAETVLVGFSQGAMMALHVALSLEESVAGVVAFSGALIPPAGFPEDTAARPPVALIHGDLDQVVDPQLSRDAAVTLQNTGLEVSLHMSPGTAHGISADGLEFATAFLMARLRTG
ncbi:MAG TPA: alpha/beta fold hydrolase [Devosiaceae bacterium]|nr:alpha/beta fold hydrolase [Devosiaceae bacterium]